MEITYILLGKKSRKTSSLKPSTHRFEMNLLHNLAKIQKELRNQTYKPEKKHEFILCERGKTRYIRGSNIKDKVIRRVFCDTILEPEIRKKIIYDNSASLKKRGLSFCRKRLKIHLQRFYREHKSNNGYILLMDYSSYYDNIRHKPLKNQLFKIFKDDYTRWLLSTIIDSFRQDVSGLGDDEIKELYDKKYKAILYRNLPKDGQKFLDKSVDIGDHSSQLFGVFFPSVIDNYIKIILGKKYYSRYMDDSYIISDSNQDLRNIFDKIKVLSSLIGIIINDTRCKIISLKNIFSFLQNRYFLSNTGKVSEHINPIRVHKILKRFKKLLLKNIPIYDVFRSWYGSFKNILKCSEKQTLNYFVRNLNNVIL